jgi:putative ABC transport system permease protein
MQIWHDRTGYTPLLSLRQDFRHGVRLLRSSPAFSAVAVATCALAIGANTAMFSFVRGLLLRPLPYPDADRIVRVLERHPNGGLNSISTLNYRDWARQNASFEYMAAEAGWQATVRDRHEPFVVRGARVTVHYFAIFGVQPALGRTFLPGEDEPGHDRVVLLSHALWAARFGSNPAAVGQRVMVDGEPHTVVGVLPKGGPFDRAAAQIWKPLAFEPSNMTRDFRWLGVSAKLRNGVTIETARAEMAVIGRRLEAAYPASNAGWGVAVDRLDAVLIGPQLRTAVMVLFAATLFVLLIGCANLASLALARSIARRGEMAVRSALGASRRRLVQQLVIENVVVAICGGAAGLGIGYAMLLGIRALIPPETLPPAVDIRLDTTVLLFTFAAALVTGVLFSIPPAAQAARASLVSPLKEGGRGSTVGTFARRVHGALVVVEIALAFVLLVASGLLLRSALKLLAVDPGFVATNVVTAGLPLNQAQHPDPVELNAYLRSVRTAIARLPGVRQCAITSVLPLQGWGYGVPYTIEGRNAADPATRRPAFFKIVSPSYFDVLGIRLEGGRVLRDTDSAGSTRVAVINETLAHREFPGADPIGRHIIVREILPGRTEFGQPIAWEIVGVIADEKITSLGDETSAGLYVSNEQSPTYGINLVIKTDMPLSSTERTIRSAIDDVNKDQAVSNVRPLADLVSLSMLGTRISGTLLTVFAAIALALAAVGVYGVMSYTATERTHEMGIRAALGASTGELRRLVFTRGMRLAVAGMVIGFLGTDPATQAMSSMVYGVGTDDPLTIAVVAVVLFIVAALGCFLPAWRITKADPMEALRYE